MIELIGLGQFAELAELAAEAERDQLVRLVLWLAPSIRPRRNMDAEMVDRAAVIIYMFSKTMWRIQIQTLMSAQNSAK